MYEVYASASPLPLAHRENIVGLRFATKAEALERACHLRRQGWSVYRVSGPDGFEMSEQLIEQHCKAP